MKKLVIICTKCGRPWLVGMSHCECGAGIKYMELAKK